MNCVKVVSIECITLAAYISALYCSWCCKSYIYLAGCVLCINYMNENVSEYNT